MKGHRQTVLWSSLASAAIIGVVLTAVLMAGLPGTTEAADADARSASKPATAVVEQGTLTGTTTKTGKLDRLDGPTIVGSAPGTITSLPKSGDTLTARSELYRADNNPVTAFEGAVPQWRAFEEGMAKGPDVQQVEDNLKAWGYFTGTPDQAYDWRTSKAVRAWQKDTGQERTGSIAQGALQFITGTFTVSNVTAAVGNASVGNVYETKRDDKVVSVNLPVGSPLAAIEGIVQVALPGHGTVPGRVTDVGAAVADESTGKTTVPVSVSLDDPAAAGDLTEASVQVDFVSEVKEDVLHVPVLALGAAVDGGFVLEVLQADGATTAVPVEAGLFAGDRVEVTGDLDAGDKVVVPA